MIAGGAMSSYRIVRAIGAYACLLATMLIYAPQGMIAWWAGTGRCCESGYCPILGHHRAKESQAGAAGEQRTEHSAHHQGMDCEHEAGSGSTAGMAACTMSCCHNTERATMAPVVFLPDSATETVCLASVARIAEPPVIQDISQSSKPPSPPPRSLNAAA